MAKLIDLCDRMEKQTDPHKWVLLDTEFHSVIASASGNAMFAKIVADARVALSRQSELVNSWPVAARLPTSSIARLPKR